MRLRSSASNSSNATESAPPETATPTRSPSRINRLCSIAFSSDAFESPLATREPPRFFALDFLEVLGTKYSRWDACKHAQPRIVARSKAGKRAVENDGMQVDNQH